jgi:hypothetical protein
MADYQFFADQLDNPVSADWKVNARAPASADTVNTGLTVRRFDDTTEEGVGFVLELPSSAANITFYFRARSQTAAATKNVAVKIYNRDIPDNAAVSAWSAGVTSSDLSCTNDLYFHYYTVTQSFATLGITAGRVTQFEITRVLPSGGAGSKLVGDWDLIEIRISFSL